MIATWNPQTPNNGVAMMAVAAQEGGWTMVRTTEIAARDAVIADLKRLITAGTYETLEKLEDAVDAFLWSEQDRLHADYMPASREMARSHPR